MSKNKHMIHKQLYQQKAKGGALYDVYDDLTSYACRAQDFTLGNGRKVTLIYVIGWDHINLEMCMLHINGHPNQDVFRVVSLTPFDVENMQLMQGLPMN